MDTNGGEYDCVVIGAGSGGVRASRWAAMNYGVKVACIELPFSFVSSDEEGGAGGTCVIRGCVPKKLLVYGSQFQPEFEDAQGFGWTNIGEAKFNWEQLIASKGQEIKRLNGVYGSILSKAGVEFIEGKASLKDKNTVRVKLSSGEETDLKTKNILVATGGRAVKLDVPGKEHAITSDEALVLGSQPRHIVIIGAGYIAVEFAGIFKGMGSEVHLFYRRDKFLRGFDEECRSHVTEIYSQKGYNLHPETTPVKIDKLDNGKLLYTYKDKAGAEHSIETDEVMFATGRKPNVKDLNLEAAGVEMGKNGAIAVDKSSKTNVDNIWAIGDVTDRVQLTPVALMEGMKFADSVFGDKQGPPDYKYIPSAVFCQPPLATVGLSEEQAVAKLTGKLDVYSSKFRPMRNTISGRQEKALMKIIVHQDTDKVVGVHMVGPDSAEIMQGIAIALRCNATKKDFDGTIGIHPSSAEEFVTMRSVSRTLDGQGKDTPDSLDWSF